MISTNPGSVLGKYHVLATLGRGGMSSVYLAVARGPGAFHKLLVLKELNPFQERSFPEEGGDANFVAMFQDEARLAALLNHPNVVQTYEVLQFDQRHIIVMEYLNGQPLSVLLKRAHGRGGLAPGVAARIATDVCAGLHYAHELKGLDGAPLSVVHRDISPHNVFVTYEGQVKIVDFGIAKTAARSVATETGVLKGKVAYMSPEQAEGIEVDRRADIFSTGIVLYEALALVRIWKDRDADVDILRALMNGDIRRSPRDVNANVPEPLDRVCQRALAPKREDRYPTALDMARELEAYLETLSPRVTSREVATLMADMFSKERASVEESIQRQLRVFEQAPSAEFAASNLPNLTLAHGLSVTPSSRATAARTTTLRREGPLRGRVWMLVAAAALAAAITVVAVRWRGTAHGDGGLAAPNGGPPPTATERGPAATAVEPPAPPPASVPARVAPEPAAPESTAVGPAPSDASVAHAPARRAPSQQPISRPRPPPSIAQPPPVDPLGDRK
jgi:serine/threonine-protein kinase